VLCVLLPLLAPLRVRAAEPEAGECAPPHTLIALLPLADQTDGTWELWSGVNPAVLVSRLLADSLEQGRGRHVVRVSPTVDLNPLAACVRAADDDPALRAGRRADAEIVVTGTVSAVVHEDTRDPGKFMRWGMGAPDARTHVRVRVTLRVLDAHDGTVIIESSAARDRVGRGTATAARPSRMALDPGEDPLVEDALSEVLGDLVATIGERLDARWTARVILEGRGVVELDAGMSRGLFTGERLDVWRPGIQLLDEDLLRIGDDARIGSVVVVALDGRGRARARLIEGDARMGDLVRPCAAANGSSMSFRR